MMKNSNWLPFALAGLLLAAVPAVAAPWRATSAGPYEAADVSGGQVVTFDAAFLAELPQVPLEGAVEVEDWPLAPGASVAVTLIRRDIYAPDARLYRMEATGPVEIPRSSLAFFTGRTASGDSIWLSIEPGTKELWGGASVDGDLYELRAEGGRRYTVASADAFLPEGAKSTAVGCGAGELLSFAGSPLFPAPEASAAFPVDKLSSLHSLTVAVDTDNELMQKKFANNTTNANNYVGQLLTAMNVMYERDLKVRLLQGTTFFRVSTTPDPYSAGPAAGGNAQSSQLNEFAAVWQANYSSVPRGLAMMLSGKQPSTNSASGIASIDALCNNSRGYSFSQVFNSPSFGAAQDAYLVGHELGHNFGSDHTHCYSPPIDGCTNFEGFRGCFNSSPSCPAPSTINGIANVRGTVMSYCNSLGGCSVTNTFHSRSIDLINPRLASRVGVCLSPVTGGSGNASRFYTLPPCRVIDTRNPLGLLGGPGLAAGATRAFTLTGTCGIPADAKAISGNITVVTPLAAGFLNAYPTGTPTSISLVNYRAGQVKANSIVLKLPASGGSLTFQNGSNGLTHFLLDVNGYFK